MSYSPPFVCQRCGKLYDESPPALICPVCNGQVINYIDEVEEEVATLIFTGQEEYSLLVGLFLWAMR